MEDAEVRNRAYLIYLGRLQHRLPGDALQDWLEAETILETPSRSRRHYEDLAFELR